MSKILVDEIAPKTSGNKVLMPQGGFIQHQYTMFTGTNTITCTTDTDIVLTDLTVNITPQSTSSIIKLEAQIYGEWGTEDAVHNNTVFFYRDTTKLSHPTAGSRKLGIATILRSFYTTDTNSTPEGTGLFSYYDSPSTTSQITYKVGINASASGNPVWYLNRTVGDVDSVAYERFISLISATEIAG